MSFAIPELYKYITHPSHNFLDTVRKYREEKKWSPMLIVLGGPTGTGKTCDAVAWLKNAKRKGHEVAYLKAADIWQLDVDDIHDLERIKALVIDDYGKTQTTGTIERISSVIDKRIERTQKYTILTTNVLRDIRSIDERLASRLNSGCVVDYTGMPDLRRTQ